MHGSRVGVLLLVFFFIRLCHSLMQLCSLPALVRMKVKKKKKAHSSLKDLFPDVRLYPALIVFTPVYCRRDESAVRTARDPCGSI